MHYRHLLMTVACFALGGCTSLLPQGSADTPAQFASFEQAQIATQRIVPMQTRTPMLKALGFDLQAGTNMTQIPYPEIVARLTPNPGVPLAKLDVGIRQCIEVQAECRGYLFRFEQQHRRREGNFWLDFFNIRRTTYVEGWWFEALIVTTDETVLFRNFAGQAHTDRVERQSNPLGPFQPAGEGAGAVILH